jgi:predicted metal-binding protein
MERVLILGCKNNMDDACIGCFHCLAAFNSRQGGFARYQGLEVELIGIMSCGGCPGTSMIARMITMALWCETAYEKPTEIYLGPCMLRSCPYNDVLTNKVKTMVGIEVIEGSHPTEVKDIFV